MVRVFTFYGRIMAWWANVPGKIKFTLTFLVGLIIGLVVLGWWLWPVQWTDAAPVDLQLSYRNFFLETVAISYAAGEITDQDLQTYVVTTDPPWPAQDVLAEVQQLQASDPTNAAIYDPLIAELNQMVAAESAAPPPPASSNLPLILLLGLLVVLIVGLSVVLVRRLSRPKRAAGAAAAGAAPTVALTTWPGEREAPLREFSMKYVLGDDHFDLSNAIDTASGMFLGECGMGISETIGTPNPSKVTAFEVWLFDKNDIRTVTTVLMSQHALQEPALKSKLAAKGDLVEAKPESIIAIETASLRIRARVLDMEYGTGQLPPNSYFQRLNVVLAAWPRGDGSVTQPADALR